MDENKNKKEVIEKSKIGDNLFTLFGLVVFITITIAACNGSDDSSVEQNLPQSEQTVSITNKKQRLEAINKILQDMAKEGLILKYEEPCYFYVNEAMWNSLPFETKKQIFQMFSERYQITNSPYVLVGYHTGERIHTAKNFK